jgi:hypothetical protein
MKTNIIYSSVPAANSHHLPLLEGIELEIDPEDWVLVEAHRAERVRK